jgi:hypothetical protein
MGNRTISLSPICDLIRKEMIEQGIPFSVWVQEQLIEWNRSTRKQEVAAKPTVPWHYECQLCHQKGHHASECSMYNPQIVRDEE